MLQLSVSESFASDLDHLVSLESVGHVNRDIGAMQWVAHSFTIMQKKCVIAMEANSFYCIIFTDLSESDINNFDKLFRMRLQQEAVTICQPKNQSDVGEIVSLSELVTERFVINKQVGDLLQVKMNQVVRELEYIIAGIGRLPSDDSHTFNIGVELNSEFRPLEPSKADYAYPIEKFEKFWLDMRACIEQQERAQIEEHVKKGDNILPFFLPERRRR